jgi:hypothetical protein
MKNGKQKRGEPNKCSLKHHEKSLSVIIRCGETVAQLPDSEGRPSEDEDSRTKEACFDMLAYILYINSYAILRSYNPYSGMSSSRDMLTDEKEDKHLLIANVSVSCAPSAPTPIHAVAKIER